MTHWISRFVAAVVVRTLARTAPVLAAAVLVAAPVATQAAGGGYPLDHFPSEKLTDQAALQNGAKLFVNYCLGCHSANLMRYNRLQDLGLTDAQIKDNLLFTGTKVGDPMRIAMAPNDAKAWFGALPPDLSVTARARSSHDGSGSDWLYTYLRSYYRDATRATGWNNAVFPNVGMPHVFYELQGSRGVTIEETKRTEGQGFSKTVITFDAATGLRTEKTEKIEGGHPHEGSVVKLGPAVGGKLTQAQYDEQVADLVAFLTYVADPSAKTRMRLGVWVLIFLSLFTVLAWWLNREYWKDIR
ncbi:MAG TPA: cytochrome c1 [Burkholderiaceae bacterium]|nr:cytochrome c1 [Burkholderiaceae bacterium]